MSAMPGTVDFEAEGLLEDLEGEARDARLQLLGELLDAGTELEELREAVAQGRLALVAVERTLAGEQRYSADEVCELSGVEPRASRLSSGGRWAWSSETRTSAR